MSQFTSDIKARAEHSKAWLFEASFPLWARKGCHSKTGFYEALDLQALPVKSAVSRVRVQARQTYSFALARQLGWASDQADPLIAKGVETLSTHCRRTDGLYGSVMLHQGGLGDDTITLYDCAFVLLAYATVLQSGAQDTQELLTDLSEKIENTLLRPASVQGYYETYPVSKTRKQNPHMHLFEARLAQYSATQALTAKTSGKLCETLLIKRLFDPKLQRLREFFSETWGPATDDRFEAGHHYEWVWLLGQSQKVLGTKNEKLQRAMYQAALSMTGPDCEIPLAHTLDGQILNSDQRSWGLCEALKAHIAMSAAGDASADKRILETYDRLFDIHITPAIEGGWIDQVDSNGARVSEVIPASIGYHIYLALDELMRFAKTL